MAGRGVEAEKEDERKNILIQEKGCEEARRDLKTLFLNTGSYY